MFRAGLKLLLWSLLWQVVVLAPGAHSYADDDFEPADNSSDLRYSEKLQTFEFMEPPREIDGVFTDVDADDSVFTRLTEKMPLRFNRSYLRPVIRTTGYDVPPAPAPDDSDMEPVAPRQIFTDPPSQLMPIPSYIEPAPSDPCDTCDPVFGGVIKQNCPHEVSNWSPLVKFFGWHQNADPNCGSDIGIGHERVMFAPFEIDASQPTNFLMVRWDSGFGLHTPDRAEYFWSMPGRGPALSPTYPNTLNFQELRFINEVGSQVFSVQTEIPLRLLEPDSGGSSSGIGDMKVATKARLVNGKRWQVTQIMRTYIPIGSAQNGMGTGHVSLEPGALVRYEVKPNTYIHTQVKYWIPIAADVGFASNVLTTGVGVSHVLYETNNFAIIPVVEFVNYDFLSGQKTVNGVNVYSGGENAYNVVTGARFVIGPKGDLGLFEFGVSNTTGVGKDRYVDDLLRFDFKFIF